MASVSIEELARVMGVDDPTRVFAGELPCRDMGRMEELVSRLGWLGVDGVADGYPCLSEDGCSATV